MNIVTKKWGENARKSFPETHVYPEQKRWTKIVWKVRKHVFYKHTNIVTKKWGEKTREKIFLETQEYR